MFRTQVISADTFSKPGLYQRIRFQDPGYISGYVGNFDDVVFCSSLWGKVQLSSDLILFGGMYLTNIVRWQLKIFDRLSVLAGGSGGDMGWLDGMTGCGGGSDHHHVVSGQNCRICRILKKAMLIEVA